MSLVWQYFRSMIPIHHGVSDKKLEELYPCSSYAWALKELKNEH